MCGDGYRVLDRVVGRLRLGESRLKSSELEISFGAEAEEALS